MWPNGMSGERRNAMIAVFRTLAGRWPKVFAQNRVSELIPMWVMALEYVQTDVLEPAALRFCAEVSKEFAPSPPEFARFAKAMQRQHLSVVNAAPVELPAPDTTKAPERIEQFSRWAHKRLGSWPLVAEVWALLAESAPDAAHRQQVRDGTLDREVFREAVTAVQNGQRVMRRGPLSDLAGAA